MSVIGVPLKVLHEAEGHIITVETNTGDKFTMLKIIIQNFRTHKYFTIITAMAVASVADPTPY